MGLKEEIRAAKTQKEVKELLASGKTFTDPAKDTQRKWKRSAEKQIDELTEKPAPVKPEKKKK